MPSQTVEDRSNNGLLCRVMGVEYYKKLSLWGLSTNGILLQKCPQINKFDGKMCENRAKSHLLGLSTQIFSE